VSGFGPKNRTEVGTMNYRGGLCPVSGLWPLLGIVVAVHHLFIGVDLEIGSQELHTIGGFGEVHAQIENG
jgi:hypothetical protein